MKAVFHEAQRLHDPKKFFSSGTPLPNPEQPDRLGALLSATEALGMGLVQPLDHGLEPISAVHTPDYLTFLQNIHSRWQRMEGSSDEVIPNIHPDRRTVGYPKSAVGQAGYHMTDTACPISKDTWQSAYWSAQTAVGAAKLVLDGDASAYALCRPPGHHAFADLAGGFCFLNNTAIAAQLCVQAGRRPAVLDVDLHHGNGTQGIFNNRGDVLTISIHADPARFYPFFWGYEQERGEGAGLGANLNLPVPRATGNDKFLTMLKTGIERIQNFSADILIIALGLDAFEGDPFKGLAITTPGFARIAEVCAGLSMPTVIVQEGGYLCPELGDNLASFLGGFQRAHEVVHD